MMRKIAVPALLAVLVVLGLAGPAHAHTSLESSDPADGAQLTGSPETVRLTFSEPILEGPNRITVTGPEGSQWQRADTLTVNGDTVSTEVAPLGPAGEYTVSYRVVSLDGHPVSGSVSFALTESAGGTPAAAARAADPGSEEARQAGTAASDGIGIWPWLAGAGLLVCGLLVLLVRRSRGGSKASID